MSNCPHSLQCCRGLPAAWCEAPCADPIPHSALGIRNSNRVYPRVCGVTVLQIVRPIHETGISPLPSREARHSFASLRYITNETRFPNTSPHLKSQTSVQEPRPPFHRKKNADPGSVPRRRIMRQTLRPEWRSFHAPHFPTVRVAYSSSGWIVQSIGSPVHEEDGRRCSRELRMRNGNWQRPRSSSSKKKRPASPHTAPPHCGPLLTQQLRSRGRCSSTRGRSLRILPIRCPV